MSWERTKNNIFGSCQFFSMRKNRGEVSSWMCCIDQTKNKCERFLPFWNVPLKKKTNDIFLFILVGEETCNLSDSFCFLSILDDPGRMPPKHWQNHDYDNRTLLYIWDLPPPSRIPTANKGLYLLYTQLKM